MQEIKKPATPETPELSGARIIPFPARSAVPEVAAVLATVSEPNPLDARLTRALNGLNSAITAQRAAMSAWKAALGDLRTVTGRLGDSLRGYNDSLGHLDSRVKTLRAEAEKLEAWADASLARARETAADQASPDMKPGSAGQAVALTRLAGPRMSPRSEIPCSPRDR